ncbi:MAG: AMIN domain-containing protein, partial [Candidatus Rokubacteria bacterium]|nr:AMIN domain-containing protein [Candidatus Rokubacteria bacterium]
MSARRRILQVAGQLAFLALVGAPAWAAETEPALTPARLSEITVTQQPEATIVNLKTSGAAKYRAEFMDSPNRLVIDLDGTQYGWRKLPLDVARDPLRQIRGSQYRKGITRVVMEFSRKVGYAIREDAEGLSVIIPHSGTSARTPATTDAPVAKPKPAVAPKPATIVAATPEPAKPKPVPVAPAPPARAATTPEPAKLKPAPKPPAPVAAVAAAPTTPEQAPAPKAALASPAPAQTAQAQPAPAPAPRPAAPPQVNGQHLISLEFKDADVVNLLRILAAESGRNVVIGDDVKGKMSISLRNVPWQLALEIILEAKGLQKLEKDGVIRIVSVEQLTKEREALARVQEAKLKAEAEIRAKLAEAQAKEAAADIAKRATEASIKEAEARGPLREEMIRLSYADPGEVAKTLQGILGIPEEGQKIQGPGVIGGTQGPIAEPPFSQLFGPPAQ